MIDVEPDGRASVKGDPWRGLSRTLREVQALRNGLTRSAGSPVHFNWFLRFDAQIEITFGRTDWCAHAYPELIDCIRGNGDLAGIHTHFWRWNPTLQRWFNELTDQTWLAQSIARSIDTYAQVFGEQPIASRSGDRFLSHHLVEVLRRHKIRYDLTLEPGVPAHPVPDDPLATSWLPDYRAARRAPYVPSVEDYLHAAAPFSADGTVDDRLWMVPLSTTPERHWLMLRRYPYLLRSAQALNLCTHPDTVGACLSRELSRAAIEPLVCVLRTGDLATPRYLDALQATIQRLLGHPNLSQFRLQRVDTAMQKYREAADGVLFSNQDVPTGGREH